MIDTRDEFSGLLWLYAGISIVVFAIIVALVCYTIVRSRRRREDPGFRSEWPRAEALYAIVLACIVAVLVAFTFRTEDRVDGLASDPGLRVGVTAFQWQWTFAYPGGSTVAGSREQPARLVVPADTTIRFSLLSRDVVHSFWVPTLRFKRDAFPEHVTRFDLLFPDEGTFTGRCAEFCGLRHADMIFDIVVLSPEDFAAWLAERTAEAG